LRFDGVDDYCEISDGNGYPDLIGNLAVGTISVWFEFDTLPPANTIHPILYLGDGVGGSGNSSLIIEIGHFPGNSKLYFTVIRDNMAIPQCFDSGTNLTAGTWYHFAAVVGSNSNTGYLNGSEMVSRHYNFGNALVSYFFDDIVDKRVCWVGRGFLGAITTTQYYDGEIDEIRIYDRPLSADEIRQYYRSVVLAASTDFDNDGDVDLADFSHFQACFNGPNRSPAASGCDDSDLDHDHDVDLADFATFQACFNGPNRPPACS
jgi:Concanavalin A-like lectin/glucanases superfamily